MTEERDSGALDGAARGPGDDGIDRPIEVGAEKDGGVACVKESGALRVLFPALAR